jgi:hypothetical protein
LGEVKDDVRGQIDREMRSLENSVHQSLEERLAKEAPRGNGH